MIIVIVVLVVVVFVIANRWFVLRLFIWFILLLRSILQVKIVNYLYRCYCCYCVFVVIVVIVVYFSLLVVCLVTMMFSINPLLVPVFSLICSQSDVLKVLIMV